VAVLPSSTRGLVLHLWFALTPMKKLAFILIILGSGLTALGISGWQATGGTRFLQPEGWDISAGWTLLNQIAITVGVMLLACGLLLRRDSS
jgi:hypothetical protein